MNQYLSKKGCRVEDLYEDLRDGVTLIVLLEILSGDKIVSIYLGLTRPPFYL